MPNIVAEAERLLDEAASAGASLSLLGGIAVRLRAPCVPPSLARDYKDLDFAVPRRGGPSVTNLLTSNGYEADREFNALNGRRRLLFHDGTHHRQVDIFVGSFQMCHEIPVDRRCTPNERTIPLAELLLTKLQIVELNEKDIRDALLLFHGHEVADHDGEAINAKRIAELCSTDWGLWRTITANLEGCRANISRYSLQPQDNERISKGIQTVLAAIEGIPKSRGWRLRARIGDRKRWYELPEEADG